MMIMRRNENSDESGAENNKDAGPATFLLFNKINSIIDDVALDITSMGAVSAVKLTADESSIPAKMSAIAELAKTLINSGYDPVGASSAMNPLLSVSTSVPNLAVQGVDGGNFIDIDSIVGFVRQKDSEVVNFANVATSFTSDIRSALLAHKFRKSVQLLIAIATYVRIVELTNARRSLGKEFIVKGDTSIGLNYLLKDLNPTITSAPKLRQNLFLAGPMVERLTDAIVGFSFVKDGAVAGDDLDNAIKMLHPKNMQDLLVTVGAIQTPAEQPVAQVKVSPEEKPRNFAHTTAGAVTIGLGALALGAVIGRAAMKR